MVLTSNLKFDPEMDYSNFSSEVILPMLRRVREDIGMIDQDYMHFNLPEILELIESGKSVGGVKDCIQTNVDLSRAKGVVDHYRRGSEGGCQSCINLEDEMIDAQDNSRGWYCGDSDPAYDPDNNRTGGIPFSGKSPKVSRHYHTPCGDSWKPKFSKTIDELLVGEE